MASSTPTTFGDDCGLMMHCDDFTDSSSYNQVIVVSNNAPINTSVKKFGAGAIETTLSSSQVVYAKSSGLGELTATGQFTYDYWLYMKVLPGDFQAVHSNDGASGNTMTGGHTAVNNVYARVGATFHNYGALFTWTASTWNHVCMTRDAANNTRVFINGESRGAAWVIASTMSFNQGMAIGVNNNNATYLDMIYDEIRIVVGTAVWATENFTPPTAPYIGGGPGPGAEDTGINAMPLMGVGHGV